MHHKRVFRNELSGSDTSTFKLRFNWINQAILKSLEVTIRAIKHGRAAESAAFKTHVPIETSFAAVDRGLVLVLQFERVAQFISLIFLRLLNLKFQ